MLCLGVVKMHIYFNLFLNFIVVIFAQEDNSEILCTSNYCSDVECSEILPEKCKIQNSTHNGLFLPSLQICNCCEYCLENLGEGEECSIGNPASATTTSICGPGLYCKLTPGNEFDGKCTRMDTPCTQKQDDYDQRRKNGTLGSMEVRQTCDDDGDFSTYKCIPGESCYCVDKKGNRIFGESDLTSLPDANMQCKCSRDYTEAVELIGNELNPSEHFRCTANGDYDVLQCIQDKCLCVDTSDGAPTYPDDNLVNITDISKDTLPCYKNEKKGIFYKTCEQKYLEILKEVKEFEDEGYSMVFSFDYPKCDIDGTYQAIQQNSTHKLCVTKEGTVLTSVDITNATLADQMDCKCVRALTVISSIEKPVCQENGNYSPVQCRRGKCRCVDSDGYQICKSQPCEVEEAQKDTLTCT